MAKIQEQLVVIKFSKILRDSDSSGSQLASKELLDSLEQVAQELAGSGVIVEVEVDRD